jgi:hypothetical protein
MGSGTSLESSCLHSFQGGGSARLETPSGRSQPSPFVSDMSPFCRSGYLVGEREVTWTRSLTDAQRLSP